METKANPEVSNTLIPSTKTLGSFSIGCWIIAEQKLTSLRYTYIIALHSEFVKQDRLQKRRSPLKILLI